MRKGIIFLFLLVIICIPTNAEQQYASLRSFPGWLEGIRFTPSVRATGTDDFVYILFEYVDEGSFTIIKTNKKLSLLEKKENLRYDHDMRFGLYGPYFIALLFQTFHVVEIEVLLEESRNNIQDMGNLPKFMNEYSFQNVNDMVITGGGVYYSHENEIFQINFDLRINEAVVSLPDQAEILHFAHMPGDDLSMAKDFLTESGGWEPEGYNPFIAFYKMYDMERKKIFRISFNGIDFNLPAETEIADPIYIDRIVLGSHLFKILGTERTIFIRPRVNEMVYIFLNGHNLFLCAWEDGQWNIKKQDHIKNIEMLISVFRHDCFYAIKILNPQESSLILKNYSFVMIKINGNDPNNIKLVEIEALRGYFDKKNKISISKSVLMGNIPMPDSHELIVDIMEAGFKNPHLYFKLTINRGEDCFTEKNSRFDIIDQ
jgi:hypothetical protein